MKDGTGYQSKQFERAVVNPNSMRNLALYELGEEKPKAQKRRKKALRIGLPSWLAPRTTKDMKETGKDG